MYLNTLNYIATDRQISKEKYPFIRNITSFFIEETTKATAKYHKIFLLKTSNRRTTCHKSVTATPFITYPCCLCMLHVSIIKIKLTRTRSLFPPKCCRERIGSALSECGCCQTSPWLQDSFVVESRCPLSLEQWCVSLLLLLAAIA